MYFTGQILHPLWLQARNGDFTTQEENCCDRNSPGLRNTYSHMLHLTLVPITRLCWSPGLMCESVKTSLLDTVGRGRVGACWQQDQQSRAVPSLQLLLFTCTMLAALQLFTTIVLRLDLPPLKCFQGLRYGLRCPTGHQGASYKQQDPLLCLAEHLRLVHLHIPLVSNQELECSQLSTTPGFCFISINHSGREKKSS